MHAILIAILNDVKRRGFLYTPLIIILFKRRLTGQGGFQGTSRDNRFESQQGFGFTVL